MFPLVISDMLKIFLRRIGTPLRLALIGLMKERYQQTSPGLRH
jgi:hypothetical protein